MLKGRIGNGTVVTHGFLLGVEVDGPLNIDAIMERMVQGVTNLAQVGQVDVEYLGTLDLVKDEEEEVFDSTTGEAIKRGVRES